MTWPIRFAAHAARSTPSAIRELLKVATRPDMISFAGGLPAVELLPVEAVRSAVDAVLTRQGSVALQYGQTEGLNELRDWIAARFSPPGQPLSREDVIITSGAQQGLDLLGRTLFDPGDRVAVEEPTYLAALSSWRGTGVEFLGIEGDEDGLLPDRLIPFGSRPPKALYLIPNFQNPRGVTLSLPRRQKLAAYCREHEVPLIEDDPYGDLRYDHEPLPSLHELDAATAGSDPSRRWVVRLGTFSKTLAPGLRVGWVLGPRPVVERLTLAKQAADLHTSTLNQWVALELATNGTLDSRLPRLRAEYRQRRDHLLTALDQHFPEDTYWTRPAGGMFLMVTLPSPLDAAALLPRALEAGVAFVPGAAFHPNGGGANTLRLNFTHPPPDRIEEGIRRLAQLLQTARP